jgi:hypothetical protein
MKEGDRKTSLCRTRSTPVIPEGEVLYENDSFGSGSLRDFGGCPHGSALCDFEPTEQGHPSDP